MLVVEQHEKRGVCNISEIRDGKFISFHAGTSIIEGSVTISNFLKEYFKKVDKDILKGGN